VLLLVTRGHLACQERPRDRIVHARSNLDSVSTGLTPYLSAPRVHVLDLRESDDRLSFGEQFAIGITTIDSL
jgi:hypothetical protein